MALEQDIDLLRRVPLFAGLTDEPLRLIAFSAETRDFPDGAVIFREQEPADSAFLILSGSVELVRERGGGRQVLSKFEAGELLGEIALITDTTRPAKAVAAGPVRVNVIRRSTFRRVLEEYPQVAVRLRDEFLTRLARLTPDLASLAQRFENIDKS